jgi:hypothetical protein
LRIFEIVKQLDRKGRKKMALLAVLSGLVLFACVLAALRSKQSSASEKIKNLSIR